MAPRMLVARRYLIGIYLRLGQNDMALKHRIFLHRPSVPPPVVAVGHPPAES